MKATILILAGLLLMLGIPVVVIALVSPRANQSPPPAARMTVELKKPSAFRLEIEAKVQVEKRVKQSLKSPDSAKFDLSAKYYRHGDLVAVGGFVTAQNALGVRIREKVTGTFVVIETGELRMATIVLDDEIIDFDADVIRIAEAKD